MNSVLTADVVAELQANLTKQLETCFQTVVELSASLDVAAILVVFADLQLCLAAAINAIVIAPLLTAISGITLTVELALLIAAELQVQLTAIFSVCLQNALTLCVGLEVTAAILANIQAIISAVLTIVVGAISCL